MSNTEPSATDLEVLRAFSGGEGFERQVEAARALVKSKRASKFASTELFVNGVKTLGAVAGSPGRDLDRLKAVATMGLLRAVTKQKSQVLAACLESGLASPLPPLASMSDGDDRFYVASAINSIRPGWTVAFASREAMAETTAESARRQLVEALVAKSPSAEAALLALGNNVNAIRSTDKQAETNGRVARRVLDAFQAALHTVSPVPGEDVGVALRDLLVVLFEVSEKPESARVVRELTDAVASTIVSIVRSRFSAMMDKTLYASLSTCKRWQLSNAWNSYVDRSASMGEVRRVILDAIRLSARLGLRDQGLMDALDLSSGTRERSLQGTRAIAAEMGALPSHIQHWLATGQVIEATTANTASEQSQLSESDRFLAHALLEATEIETNADCAQVGGAASKRLAKAIRDVADRRSMSVFGRVGDVVHFSTGEHVLAHGEQEAATVRIVHPGVARKDTAGRTHVLVKAIVSGR